MKKVLIGFCLLMQVQVFAIAVVAKLRGSVTLDGITLSQGQKVEKGGLLATKAGSFVKIKLLNWDSHIVLGPRGKMQLNTDKNTPVRLEKGACRWVSGAINEKTKDLKTPAIKTKNASFAVRGTDYFVKVHTVLGESEIIVFDGLVEMQNESEKNDKVMIKKGQWGGVGGRFGAQIKKPIDLPQSALDHFGRMLKL